MKKIVCILTTIMLFMSAVSPVSFAKETSTDTIVISSANENSPTLNHASIKVGDAEYRLWNGGGGKAFVEGDGTKDGDIVSLYSVSLANYKERTIKSFKFIYNIKQNTSCQKFYFHEVNTDTAITTSLTYGSISWESTPFTTVQSTVESSSATWVSLEADFTEQAQRALVAGQENFAVAVTTDEGVTGAYAMSNHANYTVSAEIISEDNASPTIEIVSEDVFGAKDQEVPVSFKAADEDGDSVTVHYSLDGEESTVTDNTDGVYTKSFTFEKDGTYTINAWADDGCGGKSQTVAVTVWISDRFMTSETILISGDEGDSPTKNHATIKIGDAAYTLWGAEEYAARGKTYVEGDGTKDGDRVSLYSVSLSDYKGKTIESLKFLYNIKQGTSCQKFYFHEVNTDTAITTSLTYGSISWESTPFATVQSTVESSATWVSLEADFTEQAQRALEAGRENFAVAVTTDEGVTGAYAMSNHGTYPVSAKIITSEEPATSITDLTAQYSESVVTGRCEFTNTAGNSGVSLIALYDNSYNLVNVYIESGVFNSFDYSVEADVKPAYAKAFAWESMDTLKPQCDSIETSVSE